MSTFMTEIHPARVHHVTATELSFNENELKDLFKAAIIEVLEERRDLLRGILEEALEDVGLAYAIREGESTAATSRDDVFEILEAS